MPAYKEKDGVLLATNIVLQFLLFLEIVLLIYMIDLYFCDMQLLKDNINMLIPYYKLICGPKSF